MTMLAVALVTVACSPDDAGDTTTTVSDESGTSVPDDSQAPATTTTVAPATTTTEPATTADAGCVEGTWLLDIQSFINLMQDEFTAEGFPADAVTANDGTYAVTLAPGGEFTAERDAWGFDVTTGEGNFSISMTGTETGTWSADDSTITVTVTSSDVTVSSTAEVDGQVIEIPNSPVDVPDAVAEASSYTCEGDVLTVTTDGVAITLNRG